MAVPIYVDERHNYAEVSNKDQGVKLVHGPIYIADSAKHHYSEQPKPSHLQQVILSAPIYFNDQERHHFDEIQKQAETLKGLLGPIYDVGHKGRAFGGRAAGMGIQSL